MISNGADLAEARRKLGWSTFQLARALRLSGERSQTAKRIREMEGGEREVWGPIAVAVEAFVDGWRPEGWTDEQ